jgi:acetolactate synthase-1/2/3 large subunit
MMQELSGAEIIIRTLVDLGVDTIFCCPGGAVLPIYNELFRGNQIRHILVRHEAAAGHAAQGYARSTGRPGVVLVTSGPGATNVVTPLTDAMMDSIPIIVLSGQVPTHLIGTDAFQECDTVGITRHCTKHNYLVKHGDRLAQTLHDAFHVATTGRPGPVLIDIPKDVQIAHAPYDPASARQLFHGHDQSPRKPNEAALQEAVRMLASAKRPVFYTGGGVINAGPAASRHLRDLAQLTGAPVTSTLMGLGALPASSPQWLGMLGLHGTYEANMAMNRADLIIAVGARFDDRVTGRLDAFSPHSRKVHIDIDRSSIGKNVPVDLGITDDAGEVLPAMIDQWKQGELTPQNLAPWWEEIDGWRAKDCLSFNSTGPVIAPQQALRVLDSATAGRAPIIATDVGQHQMWAAQHLGFESPNKWLTSGGLGTMGYGLPAAIGAQLAHPDELVIVVSGDASIQMNMQELATATQYRLPIKLLVLNNEHLGMVRQLQDVGYEGRYAESYSASLPDFVKVAEAYGWMGIRIETLDELEAGISAMLAHQGPVFVDCRIAKLDNCYPMIVPGGTHIDMLFGPDDAMIEGGEDAATLV